MKAAHLSTVHTASDNRIVEKEARALASAGWDVVVVIAHDRTEVFGDVRVVGVTRRRKRVARMTVGMLQTLFAALREKADVYHFHDPELIPLGLFLRALGKRVIYDVHETNWATISHKTYLPKVVRPALARLVRQIELFACARFSGIVAATPGIDDQFKGISTPRVTVQNFPKLSSHKGSLPLRSRPRVAVYAGGLSEARGLFAMVDAMELIPETLGVKLLLAGPIPIKDLDKASVRPGWKRVEFVGRYSVSALADLLSRGRVGLVLLQPMPNYLESYPTKMFEYMEAGLPVIASDFPLWRSIVAGNECGLLVDPESPAEIAQAIEHLVTDDAAAEAMGERARETVIRHYTWESEGRKLVDFYERLFHSASRVNTTDLRARRTNHSSLSRARS